jgi:hypothetical protein
MQAAPAYALDAVEALGVAEVARRRSVAIWAGATGLLVFGLNAFLSRDLFWDSYLDLAGGRYIVHHGIPHAEVWTVAGHGRAWIDQQWLAHVLYYIAWRGGGYPAVALLSTLLIASAFAALAALIAWRGVAPHRAALWSVGAFGACAGNTVIRAQSFAFPLFVALLALILHHVRKRDPSWELAAALALLVVWANVHGTVLMGAAVCVLYCAFRATEAARERRGRPLALYSSVAVAAGFSFAACPYGFSAASYYGSLIGNRAVSGHILEWSPPSLAYIVSYGFFAVLLLVVASVAYAYGRSVRIEPVELAIVGALVLLAAHGVRYQVWFVLAGVSCAAVAVAGATRRRPPPLPGRFVGLVAVAALAFAVFAAATLGGTSDRRFERLAPGRAIAAAATYAAAHPHARILADDLSSSALLWLAPATAGRVGFDARLEQFGQGDLERWFDYVGVDGPDWLGATRGYDVLLASSKNRRLVSHLQELRGWARIYGGADGVVLVRARGMSERVLTRERSARTAGSR